jgi:hypothetical protein
MPQLERLIIGLEATHKYSTNEKYLYKASSKPLEPLKAGAINLTDMDELTTATVLQRVIEVARPAYVLNEACNVIPSSTIRGTIGVANSVKAHEDVAEYEEVKIDKNTITRVPYTLGKNARQIVISDEAQMQNATMQELNVSINDVAGALAYSKNSKIAKALFNTATPNAAGPNLTLATVNPYIAINTAIKAIKKADQGLARTIVANSDVWTAFFSHDKVKGQLYGVNAPSLLNSFPVPGLVGVTGILDDHIEDNDILICNKDRYTALMQGPITAEDYRSVPAGFNGWVVRDFMQALPLIAKAGYILTDVLG